MPLSSKDPGHLCGLNVSSQGRGEVGGPLAQWARVAFATVWSSWWNHAPVGNDLDRGVVIRGSSVPSGPCRVRHWRLWENLRCSTRGFNSFRVQDWCLTLGGPPNHCSFIVARREDSVPGPCSSDSTAWEASADTSSIAAKAIAVDGPAICAPANPMSVSAADVDPTVPAVTLPALLVCGRKVARS